MPSLRRSSYFFSLAVIFAFVYFNCTSKYTSRRINKSININKLEALPDTNSINGCYNVIPPKLDLWWLMTNEYYNKRDNESFKVSITVHTVDTFTFLYTSIHDNNNKILTSRRIIADFSDGIWKIKHMDKTHRIIFGIRSIKRYTRLTPGKNVLRAEEIIEASGRFLFLPAGGDSYKRSDYTKVECPEP